MKIQLQYKQGKLKNKNPEQKLGENDKKNTLEITFENIECDKYYALIESNTEIYRTLLNKEENNTYTCEIPKHTLHHTYIKIGAYGITTDEKTFKTNRIIIPIKKHKKQINCKEEYKKHKIPCEKNCNEYPDFFEYILNIIKESITKITIEENKAYAYNTHNGKEELLQIIPLPEWVTKQELDETLKNTLTEIEIDEENGDVFEIYYNTE